MYLKFPFGSKLYPMKPVFSRLRAVALFSLVTISFYSSFSQYSTQGPFNGSSFSDDNSIGDFSFSTPGNAAASDNSRSSASALLTLFSGNTHFLKVTGFGFSIPPIASVTGIKVEIEKSATGINIFATVKDNAIRLIKGGNIVGDNNAGNSSWTGTDNYDSYGDEEETWGTEWTPAEINASDFGVAFSAKINGLATLLPSARIDHIRITVYYIEPLPIHFIDFTAGTEKENEVLLTWTTGDNDESVVFTVERSLDAIVWMALQDITGVISFSTKKYQYTDPVRNIGDRFYYRIKMTLRSGAALYTRIVYANVRRPDIFNLYPNPAKHEIFVSHYNLDNVNVFSISGQKMKVTWQKINSNELRINTSFLKPGLYVVNAGDKQRQLLIR